MRILLSALLLALAATPAAAQARLKAQATVTGDIVRIGDLVENAGVAANTPIFRAPDLGQTGAVPVRAVLDAVRPYGLIAVDVQGLSEVAVTRASRTISADDIEARIVRALVARHNLGKAENLKIMFDRDVRAIQLDANANAELSLARLNYDASSRRFDIVFELASGANASWRYTGSAVETIEAAVRDARACARRRHQGERHFNRAPPEERICKRAAGLGRRNRRTRREARGARWPGAALRRPDEGRDRAEERHRHAALRSARHRADHARQGARLAAPTATW